MIDRKNLAKGIRSQLEQPFMIEMHVFSYWPSTEPTRESGNFTWRLRPPGRDWSITENESKILHFIPAHNFISFPNGFIKLDDEFNHLSIAQLLCGLNHSWKVGIKFNMCQIIHVRMPYAQWNGHHQLRCFKK